MGKLTNWLLGNDEPVSLKLTSDAPRTSRVIMPKAPPLDVSQYSLRRYATKSELVYACIEKKAQAATDPELIVQRRNKDGDYETVAGHPAAAIFANPNPHEDGETFLRSWIASENVAGVFYAELLKSRAGIPVALYPLIPTYVVPQYIHSSQGDVLDYYSYFVSGAEIKFKPEELLIRRRESFGSVFAGISPLSVALGTVDADIALVEYKRAFFNNGGSPSGILNVKDRNMSREEIDAYQQQWQSKYGRGGTNRGGPAVLDGGQVEYQNVGSKLDELDSESITSIDESRICMAFGVPPILIGAYVGLVNVNQRASVREAQEDFWMNTMSPELKSIRKFLDAKFLPMFEDPEAIKRGDIRYNWDMSQVKALQEDVDAIHLRVGRGYKDGIYKLNEARAVVKLDAVEDEIGEQFYKAPPQFGTNPEGETKSLGRNDVDIINAEILTEKKKLLN